jgi:hypothetical protein
MGPIAGPPIFAAVRPAPPFIQTNQLMLGAAIETVSKLDRPPLYLLLRPPYLLLRALYTCALNYFWYVCYDSSLWARA